jgi:hypothetical protein
MINFLDNLLRHLFLTQLSEITVAEQVSFRPPDDEWRNDVVGLQDLALNVYLVDLRENRKLRSNERVRVGVENGQMMQQQAPTRADCHYLISAWSPAQPNLEPTVDEHRLLYQATAVLMSHAPLNPTRIYGPGSPVLPTVPEVIRDAELPTQILPVEGFLKVAEFWGTMGVNHRWKPAVYLIVTLPIVLQAETAGALVTTRVVEYRPTDSPDVVDLRYQIAGHVFDATGGAPVPLKGAWVRLETLAGDTQGTTLTDELGRFTFSDIPPGRYQFRWRAGARPEPPVRIVDVPSPTGEYDLLFT